MDRGCRLVLEGGVRKLGFRRWIGAAGGRNPQTLWRHPVTERLQEAMGLDYRICVNFEPGESILSQRLQSREESAMADNESAGGFGWFLAGLGIGALVGVLYAPKSGKETREDLRAGALEAKDRANDLYEQGKTQVGAYAEQGKQVASQYVDKSKQAAADYVDKGKEYYDKGRTQWSQYVDKGRDLIQNQADAAKAAVDAGKQAYVDKTNESTPIV
jgi:gas vesicle protein